MIPETLEPLAVALEDLVPYERNPRQGDINGIVDSLEANGQYRPIVVNRRGNVILAGNHTYQAARQLGWERIAATFVDVDEDTARRIVLVDNRSNDVASYDESALAGLLQAIVDEQGPDGLLGTGFDASALGDLLDEMGTGKVGFTDPDEVPSPPAAPVTAPGTLWRLGQHRLLCGDATIAGNIAALVGDEQPSMLWTDPPYGVEYEGKTHRKLTISNDDPGGLPVLLRDSFAAVGAVLADGAAIYVAHPAGRLSVTFAQAFVAQGWRLHQTLVWVKDTMVLGRSDHHFRHEPLLFGTAGEAEHLEPDEQDLLEDDGEHVPILFGYARGGGRRGRGGQGWWGGNRQTTVLQVPRPKAAREHPTMKPVQLIEIAMRNSSRREHLVLDPFGGSGSTLIAAERLGRRARLVELDPAYCDVICRRYQAYTGTLPIREADGEPHDFIA